MRCFLRGGSCNSCLGGARKWDSIDSADSKASCLVRTASPALSRTAVMTSYIGCMVEKKEEGREKGEGSPQCRSYSASGGVALRVSPFGK